MRKVKVGAGAKEEVMAMAKVEVKVEDMYEVADEAPRTIHHEAISQSISKQRRSAQCGKQAIIQPSSEQSTIHQEAISQLINQLASSARSITRHWRVCTSAVFSKSSTCRRDEGQSINQSTSAVFSRARPAPVG